jgi:hypothetical protein
MDEMQGVMALPEAQGAGMRPEDMALIEQIRQNVPRQEITQEFLAAGEQADPQAVAEFKQELAGLQLTPDELNKLNTMVDAILAAPQDYASLRRAYLAEGMSEDLLPEQFDPAFFAALNMALDTIAMNPGSPPPMAMARGGVADLAAYGRNGDTMLAHITPQEAAMLKRMGGSGTINPYTGLPEYASIFKKIGNAVKKFAKSTVGKVVIGAALGFFVGPAAASFLGVTSTAGMAAVSGFVGGAGSTLAAGGGLKNALRSGALAALTAGAGAAITGGAAAFEPRVLGGQNPNVFGFGQPEVAATPGVGTAADIIGTPEMQIGQYNVPVPDRIPGVGPLGSQISQQPIPSVEVGPPYNPLGIDVRPSPPAPLIDPRFGGEFVSQADRFGADIPLDTGGLRPDELKAVAENTGPGTYKDGVFTPRTAAQTSSIEDLGPIGNPNNLQAKMRPFDSLTSPSTQTSLLDKAKGLYQEYISPDRYANDPDVLNAQKAAAIKAKASAIEQGLSPAGVDRAIERAVANATPGAFTRYAPLAALGVGALGAMGGFKAKEATPPDMTLFRGPSPQQLAAARLYYGGIRPTSYGSMYLPGGYAEGGGVMDTPQAMRVGGKTYPRKIGAINGPGTGTSDSIPAMLSDGEFVFTAKAVRAMGNGSRRKGAKKMYKLMKMLEGKAA